MPDSKSPASRAGSGPCAGEGPSAGGRPLISADIRQLGAHDPGLPKPRARGACIPVGPAEDGGGLARTAQTECRWQPRTSMSHARGIVIL